MSTFLLSKSTGIQHHHLVIITTGDVVMTCDKNNKHFTGKIVTYRNSHTIIMEKKTAVLSLQIEYKFCRLLIDIEYEMQNIRDKAKEKNHAQNALNCMP